MSNPSVSIVVASHNTKLLTAACVDSLLRTNYPNFEIIVVDDMSTDGSYDYLLKLFAESPRVRVQRSTRWIGFVSANNLGARLSEAEYLVFLNSDTTVEPDWLYQLVSYVRSNAGVGACQPKLMWMHDRSLINAAGGFVSYLGIFHTRGRWQRDALKEPEEVFFADGAALMVRRELFEAIGSFDSSYNIMVEDTDLCWRMRLAGYSVALVPTSLVYHKGGSTTRRMRRAFFQFHHTKNSMITIVKNRGTRELFLYMPLIVGFKALWGSPLSLIKALVFVLHNLPAIWKERRWVQESIRRVDEKQMNTMLLPIQFDLAVLPYALRYGRDLTRYSRYEEYFSDYFRKGTRFGAS